MQDGGPAPYDLEWPSQAVNFPIPVPICILRSADGSWGCSCDLMLGSLKMHKELSEKGLHTFLLAGDTGKRIYSRAFSLNELK